MLAAMVSLNSTVSCGTTAIARRSADGDRSQIGVPSSRDATGIGLIQAKQQTDQRRLPEPLSPTTATVLPAGTVKLTLCRTARASR